MDFDLTPKQLMLKKMVKEFADNEIEPYAAEMDEENKFPRAVCEKMMATGLMGIPYPQQYGGAGGTTLDYVIATEEIGKASAAVGTMFSVHTSLACAPIFYFGTEEQKEKYLRPLLSGKALGSFGLTEPNAGTDSAAQQTMAAKDGDCYILNGSKMFITNAGESDIYIIFAMTNKEAGNRGISAFIVDKDTPGLSFGHPENKMGIRASVAAEVLMKNVAVPEENLLGKENGGFKIAMSTLDGGRIGIAAMSVGIAQAALESTINYMKTRVQFGKPISANQGLQWMLADMATRVAAARMMVQRAALAKDAKKPYSVEAAMAKLYCSETAMYVTTQAVQMHGGYGYMKDYPLERYMRDAKITEIYEGTSQVQKMVISGNILR